MDVGIVGLLLVLITWLEPPGPEGMADWWAGHDNYRATEPPARPTTIRYFVDSAVNDGQADWEIAQMVETSDWPTTFIYDSQNPNVIIALVGAGHMADKCTVGPWGEPVFGCAMGVPGHGWLLINYQRWQSESPGRRQYLIEHELGHFLGLPHWPCFDTKPVMGLWPCNLNLRVTAAEIEMLPGRRDQ